MAAKAPGGPASKAGNAPWRHRLGGDFDTYLNDKLQFLLDATLGFINIAQNNVMKVLTAASAASIPPVLVVGIYGMKFKGRPDMTGPGPTPMPCR